MLYNPNISAYLLGAIMKNTDMLFNPSYPLTKHDFEPIPIHYVIFVSAVNLAKTGVKEIQAEEIDNFLQGHPAQLEVFNDGDGMEFIATVKELSAIENYEYYYKVVRKFSLLRDLKAKGFDIKEYFDELGNEADETAKLDKLTLQDILDDIDSKADKFRNKYDVEYVRNEMMAGEDTEALLSQFEQAPAFGALLQSPYLTTLYQGWCQGHLLLRSAASGVGKALTNDTVIPTPIGFRRVDEIKVGDALFDSHGNPTKVLGIYPQGECEVFEVKFADGRSVKCNEEHLWTVHVRTTKPAWKLRTLTTKQLSQRLRDKNGFNFHIPLCDAVEYPTQEFYVPPYVMGLILGDGSFRTNKTNSAFTYSAPDSELPGRIANMMGWSYSKNSGHNYNWSFRFSNGKLVHVPEILKEYPSLVDVYSGNKFIPTNYLCASKEQRMELLRGLMDTDGHVSKDKGQISFTTTAPQLKDDVMELCYSLGLKASCFKEKRNKYRSGGCWCIRISADTKTKANMFSYTPKKQLIEQDNMKSRRRENHRRMAIVDVCPCGHTAPMTCFRVDNDEHLFLANDYIVTHNTRMVTGDLCTIGATELWDDEAQDFIQNPNYQGPSFFIHTEMQTREEINPMFLACIANVEYRDIRNGKLTPEQRLRVIKAGEILLQSQIRIVDMPDFTSASIERKVKECVGNGAKYGVFDYIQLQSALGSEYKQRTAIPPREDLVLKALTTDLKAMAEKYDIGIYSMTQLNDSWKTSEFPDEGCLSGAKSIKTKIDAGSIVTAVKDRPKEFKRVEPFIHKRGFGDIKQIKPNVIEYVYKARYGQYADQKIKVWSYFDKGTMRRKDFFCTDVNDEIVKMAQSVGGK